MAICTVARLAFNASSQSARRTNFSFADPFPKPSYLFACVAGKLEGIEDWFTTASGRKVRLAIWSEPESIDQCGWAMESLKAAMRWDEEESTAM